MTKEKALKTIKLLSALESWSFSSSHRLPDYLLEDLTGCIEMLERIVLAPQPEVQDSTCSKTLQALGQPYPRTCKKCGKGPCVAELMAHREAS